MLFLRHFAIGSMLAIAAVATPLLESRQNVAPGPVKGDTFIHDPTVVKTPGGTYLAAFTADNVGLKTSTDRTNWKDAGSAFPNGAPWTTKYTKGEKNLWAPDLSYHDGKYFLYYSASSFGSSRSAIFLATSTTGASGSWTNQGLVIESTDNSGYNAIDPNLIIDAQGKWWMSFGSFWSGIKMVELSSKTGKPANNKIISIATRPDNAENAIEAPFITRHGNYYYLWVSFDRCCKGADSTYRIMVGRSTSVTGPYVDKSGKSMMQGGGTRVMSSHGAVHGPGHNAVFTDNDADVLVYHYYNNAGTAQLGINLIRYSSGWPVVY
ncbi:arabinan endo-alpha-l-arabinosidase [Colletotrichum truncatum]|uniref:Arabinan endo-alpha-l-arabinosidase n=1 Tax=Colletotrichum truncatum TaxID=5467 RepID=A0ACC3YKV4_COLTU|nr:arabinan endo-alpha-l-arabinosidase [Colletotrichum truncatum]KAF6782886.1 arabinan endo-alpha-l-arabinosidase [Colletotrichum truncatum]